MFLHPSLRNTIVNHSNVLTDNSKCSIYAGFDPTAPDLHIGHLSVLSVLKVFAERGHHVFLLVGDSTAKIGDPSFRSSLRTPQARDDLALKFEENLTNLFKKLLTKECQFTVLRNSKWHTRTSIVQFMEEIATHIKVSDLIKRDSIKERLSNGMNFAELTYPLLQAYDFVHLYKKYNCKLQIGGNDQWGNITTGTEIINRLHGDESALGLTIGLLSSEDGKKMGKSSKNATWLTGMRSSPISVVQALENLPKNELFEYAFDNKNTTEAIAAKIYDGKQLTNERGDFRPMLGAHITKANGHFGFQFHTVILWKRGFESIT